MAEIANERLKLLTSLLVDLKTSVRGQNGVEFDHKFTWLVRFFLALLLAKIANERLIILTSKQNIEVKHLSQALLNAVTN